MRTRRFTLSTMHDLTSDIGHDRRGHGRRALPDTLSNLPDIHAFYTSGSSTVEETITVRARLVDAVQVPPRNYNSCLSPRASRLCKRYIFRHPRSAPRGAFTYGGTLAEAVGDKTALYSIGQTVNFGNTEITGDAGDHTVTGTVYSLSEGTSVRSAQAGKVVYSGRLDATGNTVIIYHGYGIYTYYYHLAEATVAYDAAVTDGRDNRHAGSTVLPGAKRCSFRDQHRRSFIDPAELLG